MQIVTTLVNVDDRIKVLGARLVLISHALRSLARSYRLRKRQRRAETHDWNTN